MLTIPPLKKIISRSRSSKMRNTNAITNSSSSVTSIETRADRNGGGLVYHRSDCGYPRHRVYGDGGNFSGFYRNENSSSCFVDAAPVIVPPSVSVPLLTV